MFESEVRDSEQRIRFVPEIEASSLTHPRRAYVVELDSICVENRPLSPFQPCFSRPIRLESSNLLALCIDQITLSL